MRPSDVLRAAEAIVTHAALVAPRLPLAGLQTTTVEASDRAVEGLVISVERGVVEIKNRSTATTQRLIAPPMIAEALKRSTGLVTVMVDARDRIVGYIGQD